MNKTRKIAMEERNGAGGQLNEGGESKPYPVCKFTNASWEQVTKWVLRQCQRHLSSHPSIDPQDACQNVLINVLRRDFERRFDPRKGTFWQFVGGIVRNECQRLIRLNSIEQKKARAYRNEVGDGPSHDPVVLAQSVEFQKHFEAAVPSLTPTDQSVLENIVQRAKGYPVANPSGRSTIYVRERRCRMRLRKLLRQFECK